jgi:FixJ family two-component response regulator
MPPRVTVVDDDISVRESLKSLISSFGMDVKVFASAEALMSSSHPCMTDCFIFDVRLPGMSGIELNRHLIERGCQVPAIFITGHATDQRTRADAWQDSTIAYLIKPFSEEELLSAVQTALKWKPTGNA